MRAVERPAVSLEDRRQGIAADLAKAYAAMWLHGELGTLAIESTPVMTADELRDHLRAMAVEAMMDAVSKAHDAFDRYRKEVA